VVDGDPSLCSLRDAAEHKALNDESDDWEAVNAAVTRCLLHDEKAGRGFGAGAR
jgi:hypothetical protein